LTPACHWARRRPASALRPVDLLGELRRTRRDQPTSLLVLVFVARESQPADRLLLWVDDQQLLGPRGRRQVELVPGLVAGQTISSTSAAVGRYTACLCAAARHRDNDVV